MLKKILFCFLFVHICFAEDSVCPQGQVYDNSLNRCVLASSTVDNKTEALECSGLEGAEAQKCFDKNVTDDTKDLEAGKDPESSYIIPGIITLGAGYVLYNSKESLGKCSSTSVWLMLGGGVTSILGEMLAQNSYKKSISKLTKQYKEDVNETTLEDSEGVETITQNQTRAFDFQIEQEEARKKAHKARKSTYNLAFGLYSAAALAAIVEGFTNGWSSAACETGSSSMNFTPIKQMDDFDTIELYAVLSPAIFMPYRHVKNLNGNEFHEVLTRKVVSIFMSDTYANPGVDLISGAARDQLVDEMAKKAAADTVKELAASTADDIAASSKNLGDLTFEKTLGKNASESGSDSMVEKAVKSPGVRAAVAGLLAGYSKSIANKAGKLADISSNRIEALKDLRNDFISNGGAGFQQCSEADRKSPSKPFCFCYDSNGKQDQSKKENSTCTSIWSTNKLNMIAGTYGKDIGDSAQGVKGCLRRNGVLDPGCNCRKESSSTSPEACTSITGTISLGALKGLNGLDAVINDAAKLTSGQLSTADLANGNNVQKLTNAIKKQTEKMEGDSRYAPTLKKISDLQKNIKGQMTSNIKNKLASNKLSNPFGSFGSDETLATPKSKNDVLAKTKSDIKTLNKFIDSGSAPSAKKSNFDFNLGAGSGDSGVEVQDGVAEVMEKKFNYNSINENQDSNIFQIISVRYQRSGFQRLFDQDAKAVDEASEVQIHGAE